MSILVRKGVIRDGQVFLEEPINLPDGSEVTITGIPLREISSEADRNRPMTPEEIAATLAAMDRIVAFEMTPEEEVALAADRQARKEWDKQHFAERAEKLRRMWE